MHNMKNKNKRDRTKLAKLKIKGDNMKNKNKRDRIFLARLKNFIKIIIFLIVLILGLRLVDDRPPKTTLQDYIEKNDERLRQQEKNEKLKDYQSLTHQEKIEYEQKINR